MMSILYSYISAVLREKIDFLQNLIMRRIERQMEFHSEGGY